MALQMPTSNYSILLYCLTLNFLFLNAVLPYLNWVFYLFELRFHLFKTGLNPFEFAPETQYGLHDCGLAKVYASCSTGCLKCYGPVCTHPSSAGLESGSCAYEQTEPGVRASLD